MGTLIGRPLALVLLLLCAPGVAVPQQAPATKAAPRQARPQYVPREHEAAFNVKPVTIAQLEEVLRENYGRRDADVARELSGMSLTERMSSARLDAWKTSLHGRKTRQALVALADASAFLDAPRVDVLANPAPGIEDQKKILMRAVEYLNGLGTRLPNLYAARTTTQYDDTEKLSGPYGTVVWGGQPWHVKDIFTDRVTYSSGREEVTEQKGRHPNPKKDQDVLTVSGTFGPLLTNVFMDSVHGSLYWSHWEQGRTGPEAVFAYKVPLKESHFRIAYRNYNAKGIAVVVNALSPYRGKIGIDAATGTILRLTVEAELAPQLPVKRSDILVEYGPVELGGKTYYCPARSVAVSVGREVPPRRAPGPDPYGPEISMMNDIVFDGYHLFRGDLRILTQP